MDSLFEHFQRFAAVRLREARVARLEKAGRVDVEDWRSHRDRIHEAVRSFSAGVRVLGDHAEALRAIISPALDDVIALAADEAHPLRRAIHAAAKSFGFSSEEAGWLFGELGKIGYRPVQLLCANGYEDLAALLAGTSTGERGLLMAGFVRFTEDPATDERLRALVIRLREKGVTASIFLALAVILTAHFVASHEDHKG
jgi:hypothetical protein